MRLTNNDIRRFLGIEEIDKEFTISQVDTIRENRETLMFINKTSVDLISLDSECEDCVFLIDPKCHIIDSKNNDFITISNPKFRFCQCVEQFYLKSRFQRGFFVDPLASNPHLSRTNYCWEIIEGNNCQIDEGVILGGTDFSPVIGSTRSELIQFPQMGGVKLGNNVLIKYNTMIGKGTFGFTEIEDNTMIDFGCQIGHNCIIGKSCIIAAGTIIGGSTVIGDNTTIGIGAKIRNGLNIGNNVSIGMGAVVIHDVPDNCVVVGNPARIIEHDHIMNERGLV